MEKNHEEAEQDMIRTIEQYGDMLFGLCFVMLADRAEAEDAVQDTMLRYIQRKELFQDEAYKKAWLITVASNRCKDILRFRSRHKTTDWESIADMTGLSHAPEESGILEALMKLPEKFRIVMTLYYVEEYNIREIAGMIGKTQSAVKMRLSKGRKLLEETYRKEYL